MSANQKRQETMRRKKQIQRGEVTLRLWAVARVSLPGKGVQFGSLDQQQNMIQRWAETEFGEKGIKFEITRLIDEERSGRKEKVHLRRDLKEIRKAMVEKSIDGVIFEKICRIMRSKSDFFEFLEFSRKHGCQVFTIEDGDIDSDVRGKSLITAIKATMAEDYSDELAEKICKKQREAKVNNGKDSSTKPVLGLDPDGNFRGFYKVNEQERVIVLDIFNCFNANGNLKKTASYCNEKGYKTKEWVTAEKFNRYGERVPSRKMGGEAFDSRRLRELLANDKYLGCSSFIDHLNQFPAMQDEDGRVFWSYKHGPVVPESTFIRAQELLEKIRRRHVSASSKRVYLLSGILSDNKGRMYQGNSAKSGDYLYYKLKDSLFLIPKEEIEKIVIDRMKMQLTENSSFKKLLCSVSQRGDTLLKNLRDKLKETRKYKFEKEKKLGEFDEIIRKEVLSKQGEAVKVVSYFLELQKKDEAEIVALKEQEAALEKEIDLLQSSLKTTELNSILSQAMKSFDKKDDHQKRMILQGLIKNVIVLSNSKIEIIYSGSLLEGSRHSGETSVRLERKWRAEVTPLEPEFLQLFQKYPQLHPTEIIDDFEPFGFRSTNVSKKFLQQKYVKDGLSASQIGSMLGFSKQTILKKLSEFNIPIREPHKPHGRYAQLPYGKRCHGGSSAPFKKELQIIQRIKNLRAQGKSLREIAQTLNLKGVPTKCKSRSGWHPQMVKRCLDSSM